MFSKPVTLENLNVIIGKKVEHSLARIQQRKTNKKHTHAQVAMQVAMLWRKDGYALYMLTSKEMVLPLTALSMEQEQKLNAPSL